LILLAGLLGYSQYKRFRLKKESQLQAEILKQQEMKAKAILEAEENERQRIAKDLHDGVGQMMSAAKMNLSAIESEINFTDESQKQSFEKIIALVDDSCREVRTVSHIMMPNALLKSNLPNAIHEFVNKLSNKSLRVQVYTEGLDEKLDSNLETVLYRVIQECVHNTIKHAGATTLDISLIRDKDGISGTIEDNGKGFDPADKENFEGIGLRNIITRIEYLRGTVDFDSAPGRGTLIALHVPA
jgi:signal transduction histidine kinase